MAAAILEHSAPVYQGYKSPRALAIDSGHATYVGGKMCQRGHVGPRFTVNGICCACGAENQKIAYDNGLRPSPDVRQRALKKWNASSKGYDAKLRWKEKDPRWAWVVSTTGGARTRAKNYGIPFDLTNEYVLSILPDACPILGIVFDFAQKGAGPRWNSASIDRTIPELGYVIGNVSVISHRANAIKNDASAEEVMKVALWLATL